MSLRVLFFTQVFARSDALVMLVSSVGVAVDHENSVICDPASTVMDGLFGLLVLVMVAAASLVESMMVMVMVVPFLARLMLVPRTPAMSPPPPRLTPVLVMMRPQSCPSERMASATVCPPSCPVRISTVV